MAFAEDLQELHHGEKEYCRESGPLNSRKIDTPAAALLNGLELVASALAAAMMAALIAAMYILSAPLEISETSAKINVKIHNRPEGAQIEYILTEREEPDIVIVRGTLDENETRIHFRDLEPGTTYIVDYYVDEDGTLKKLDEFTFTTPSGGNPSDPEIIPGAEGDGNQMPEAADGEEPTDPTTQTDAPTEPTETEETTEPTWWPGIGGGDDDEDEGATEPTAGPTADKSFFEQAEPVMDEYGDMVVGYRAEEIHTFKNVVSDEVTIGITQGGAAVEDYSTNYDAETQTLTVTFTGNPIALGQTASSTVTLTDENGNQATSSKQVTAPNLAEVTLVPVESGEGSVIFTVGGTLVQPSEGSLSLEIMLIPDVDGSDYRSALMSTSDSTFAHTFTVPMDRPGETLTAELIVSAVWSADTEEARMYVSTQAEYTLLSKGGMTFDYGYTYIDDAYDPPREYNGYSVEAKFTDLDLNAIDQSTVSVAFTGSIYELGEYGTREFIYQSDEPQTDLQWTISPDDGTITASVNCPDDMFGQFYRQTRWTAVLSFNDVSGNPHTVTVKDTIAAGYPELDRYVEYRIYSNEDGEYLADIMLQQDLILVNPGVQTLVSIVGNGDMYTPDENDEWNYNPTLRTEIDGSIYRHYFTGTVIPGSYGSYTGAIDMTYQPNYDWTFTPWQESNCPPFSAMGYSFNSDLTDLAYDDVSGTWSATEIHVFYGIDSYDYEYNSVLFETELPQGAENVEKVYDPAAGTYTISFRHTGMASKTGSTVTLLCRTPEESMGIPFRGRCESTITYPEAPSGFSLQRPTPPVAQEPDIDVVPGVSSAGIVRDVTFDGSSYAFVEEHTFSGITGYVLGVEIHRNGYVSGVPYTIRRDGDRFTVTLETQTLDQSSTADSRVIIRWNHKNGDQHVSQNTLIVTPQLLDSNLP